MLICDAQVHAGPPPALPAKELLAEMAAAGVDRCVVVPIVPPPGQDPTGNNQAALQMGRLDKLAVMAPFALAHPERVDLLTTWRSSPGMLGVRLAFLRDPNRSLLQGKQLEWFWNAAEQADIPIMLLAPDLVDEVDRVAAGHPRLRLVLDHLNLDPFVVYDDLSVAIQPLLRLARRDNVATKASALPCWARDPYPHLSLREPIAQVVEAFGPRRVFWGSDLTRLSCSYLEAIRLFTELPFLGDDDKGWIMGRGLMEWLRWDAGPTRERQVADRPLRT